MFENYLSNGFPSDIFLRCTHIEINRDQYRAITSVCSVNNVKIHLGQTTQTHCKDFVFLFNLLKLTIDFNAEAF